MIKRNLLRRGIDIGDYKEERCAILMEIKLSLIVPTLGERESELEIFFNSLLNQIYRKFEVIIISQDNHQSVEKLCNIYNKHISINHIKINKKGLSLARNVGIQYAVGEVIVLSDDDCWYPNYGLKLIVEQFEEKDKMDVLLTQIYDPVRSCLYKKYSNASKRINNMIELLSRSSIEISYRKNNSGLLFDEHFGLGAKYVSGEENDFLIQCLKLKRIIFYVPKVTVFHQKKVQQETKEQLIAKGAFYSKNFGFLVSNIIVVRDLIVKRQNNYKWFWYGYYDLKKGNKYKNKK